jgi:hypothetical protein
MPTDHAAIAEQTARELQRFDAAATEAQVRERLRQVVIVEPPRLETYAPRKRPATPDT